MSYRTLEQYSSTTEQSSTAPQAQEASAAPSTMTDTQAQVSTLTEIYSIVSPAVSVAIRSKLLLDRKG